MRLIYDMPSNNIKLSKVENEILLEVKSEWIKLSKMEVEDLVDTLTKLNDDLRSKNE